MLIGFFVHKMALSLKNYVNVASKSNKQKNFFSGHLEGHWILGSGSEPYQYVTDPQHWLQGVRVAFCEKG
jgi:hypothetical protein